ncbi:MAG TPA: ribonuclease H-like domain-containing protein [Candidatus Limnocylindrales bacterium]|nr:ribonuclease H-like domain-containing protein [Candidatus Limnocylindrales bacterium]
MTIGAAGPASLARRLERYRGSARGLSVDRDVVRQVELPHAPIDRHLLAERLAWTVGGEVVANAGGLHVRCEPEARTIPLDRERLAILPAQPPPGVPLVCLDTETTGLATAAGTVAFLIGLGWWEGDRFRQVQLLLPDHADEPALLTALADLIPVDGWLVTYNGRGFDWPLLVTRYRMARRAAPIHGGHLDLLPVVRRLFRHRLDDARLRTAETGLLGLRRHGDIDGSEIPGRYLGFLRGGPAEPLVEVVRHNDQDVRSLAWLLVHLADGYGSVEARRRAPAGDLAGLARAYARVGRLSEAFDCYETALAISSRPMPVDDAPLAVHRVADPGDAPWWSPSVPADFGGRPARTLPVATSSRSAALARPWTTDRIAVERADILRRLGRWDDAADAWAALAAGPGRTAIVAAIELAKIREHRLRDPVAALDVTRSAMAMVERRRALGRPDPRIEADLTGRATRLRRRVAIAAARDSVTRR